MRPLTAALATFSALIASSGAALAEQVPDAGQDQSHIFPRVVTLAGSVAGRSPLDFLTADGDGPTEDHMLRYDSVTGTTAIGPLQTSTGVTYGFPTDLVRVGTGIYGVDAGHRQIFVLDETTGLVTPVGSPWSGTYLLVESLAYDPAGDRLFGVDRSSDQLLQIDRVTGAATPIGNRTLLSFDQIFSLAWRESDSMLYAVDDLSDSLVRIDPTTGVATFVARTASEAISRIDDLVFYDDELYAMHTDDLGPSTPAQAQLQRIDLATGTATNVGPLLFGLSAHSLIVNSIPEPILWTKVSGPGDVAFSDAQSLTPTATFSAPGTYVLRLTVETANGPVFDEVTIVERDCTSGDTGGTPGKAFLLPTKVRVKFDAAKPERSSVVIEGAFDTGGGEVALAGGATLEVGGYVACVDLVPNSSGRTFRSKDDHVDLTIAPSRTGSSRAAFKLKVTDDLAGAIDAEGVLRLRFANRSVEAEGRVGLRAGKFDVTDRKGELFAPAVFPFKVVVKSSGDGQYGLFLVAGLSATGPSPATAPAVKIGFRSFEATVASADFESAEGERFVAKNPPSAPGIALVVVDYATETVIVKATDVDLGTFGTDPSVETEISVALGTDARAVDVRIGRHGTKLTY